MTPKPDENAEIEKAKQDVQAGKVRRIVNPGQWRVFKDATGAVVVEIL